MALCMKVPQAVTVDYVDLLMVINELQDDLTHVGADTTMGAIAALMSIATAATDTDEFFETYSVELNKLKAK